MNFRKRPLLDLAHALHECTNCGRHVVEGLEPAHQNGVLPGKGFGIKANDNRHAALCHECHAWYDQGTGRDPTGSFEGDRAGKLEMWIRAHLRTFDQYFRRGWLAVKRP